ncbi:GNAT family N-acetyltransferase [Streptomyces sp. NPDC048330]|uniref:GNAT family N-acetyltransferase n=1 Tax=Streptomyces sp. NPDC048330 TaxID=3365533 RepID=UPI00371C274F
MTFDGTALSEGDLEGVVGLALRCAAHDGGLPATATADFLRRWYAGPGTTALGVFSGGRLVACGARRPTPEGASLTGLVDPDHRRRGLGAELFDRLAAARPGDAGPLGVETESLKPYGERFLGVRGFARVFAEDVLVLGARTSPPPVAPPGDVTVEEWSDGNRADFHAAYRASFADRPGFPDPPLDHWVDWTVDDTFLPACSLLARDAVGAPVAFVTCAEGYLVQVGCVPDRRRTGLGRALAAAALTRLRARGDGEVFLDVNADNPGSAALFRGLGLVPVARRARFARSG